MRIAIMGAGGLGAYYGAMLARGGHDVGFIARGEHLRALQQQGLHVESAHVGDFHLPRVNASDDPAAIGPVDAVLMGVKAYDLESASKAIAPLLGAQTFVVPLLNGVDMAERIGAVVGAERVLGGTVFLSCNVIAPGRLRHVFNGPLVFGELGGGRSARADALESALREAGAAVQQSQAIRRDLWRKYVMVAALAGVSCVVRAPTQVVRSHPDIRALFADAMREVEALARASGVELEPDLVQQHLAFADSVSPQHTVSTLIDLRARRRLELDAFQGTIVRLGQRLGVPTPINRVLFVALERFENGPPE
jgi:2-dehydropantoate 2-reductase